MCLLGQEERAEQLRSLAFLAGIILSFSMAALYQLTFAVTDFAQVYTMGYALTIGLTVQFTWNLNLYCYTQCDPVWPWPGGPQCVRPDDMRLYQHVHRQIGCQPGLRRRAGLLAPRSVISFQPDPACAEMTKPCKVHFLARARKFAASDVHIKGPPAPHRTFGMHWTIRCEADWRRAYSLFTLGAVLVLRLVASLNLRSTPVHSRRRGCVSSLSHLLGLAQVPRPCFSGNSNDNCAGAGPGLLHRHQHTLGPPPHRRLYSARG